jgi:hypothetical protein
MTTRSHWSHRLGHAAFRAVVDSPRSLWSRLLEATGLADRRRARARRLRAP